jgi:hypothetical protein
LDFFLKPVAHLIEKYAENEDIRKSYKCLK